MKQPFWSLRPKAPRPKPRGRLLADRPDPGYRAGSWHPPGRGSLRRPVVAAAQLDATVFQRRCAHRVIDLIQGKPEQYIIDQLNLQCFNPIKRPAPPVRRACIVPMTWRPTVAMPRVFGCLLG